MRGIPATLRSAPHATTGASGGMPAMPTGSASTATPLTSVAGDLRAGAIVATPPTVVTAPARDVTDAPRLGPVRPAMRLPIDAAGPTPPIRIHVQRDAGTAEVWIGADTAALADLPEIVESVRQSLRRLGLAPRRIVCNGVEHVVDGVPARHHPEEQT